MNKLSILREFWDFLSKRKKWWLIPVVAFLIILGIFVYLSQSSVIAPFVYTLF